MTKVLAITNQKGGVGKTTTAVNLSTSIALHKRKTLLIDIDPQGNTSTGIGLDKSKVKRCIYDVLINQTPIKEIILPTQVKYLDILPSTIQLAGAEIELVNYISRESAHWGGVEIGINGYVTPDFNTNWGYEYDYLNLRYEKSIQVNLNIYEQNIPLNKDKNMGLVTGIGMAWNNWRFSQPTYLAPDSSELKGFYMRDVSVRKTKLTAMYITVPLMYEIQTKNPRRIKRFHFGIGVLMSARVRTHTKIYFNEANKEYYLEDPADQSGDTFYGPYITPNTTYRNIQKDFNSFDLQPFRFDGMIRIGYGIVNLWGHFGLNQMFKKDRGPELYTWAAGITQLRKK